MDMESLLGIRFRLRQVLLRMDDEERHSSQETSAACLPELHHVLIPGMDRQADWRYRGGRLDYNVAWILLTFLGAFGIHRFYMGKWITRIIYLFTIALFGLGWLYDLWTLNEQIDEINSTP